VIALEGHYYDGVTSRRRQASLALHDDGEVRLIADGEMRSLRFSELEIAPRVGNTPRSIFLPDVGKFETTQNDAVDAALERLGRASGSRLLHRLETRLRFVLAALAIVAVSVWGFVQHGLPALAKAAAFALPAETSAAIGQGTLEILDRAYLEPSTLEATARARVEELFAAVARDAAQPYDLRLRFRAGGAIGPNALALPSGDVILTDELVALCEHDGELVSVLAHEVGHLVQRHALRQAIQDSTVAAVAILLTGDLSSTSSLVASVPTLLVEARFSQAFEREADSYALAYLQRAAIDPAHFANLMRRMQEWTGGESSIASFLSTHPSSAERIRRFSDASESPS
jgi:predicted Zn-dependent protease